MDNVSAILEIPASVISNYEKVDARLASMSKNIDEIVSKLSGSNLGKAINLSVDSQGVKEEIAAVEEALKRLSASKATIKLDTSEIKNAKKSVENAIKNNIDVTAAVKLGIDKQSINDIATAIENALKKIGGANETVKVNLDAADTINGLQQISNLLASISNSKAVINAYNAAALEAEIVSNHRKNTNTPTIQNADANKQQIMDLKKGFDDLMLESEKLGASLQEPFNKWEIDEKNIPLLYDLQDNLKTLGDELEKIKKLGGKKIIGTDEFGKARMRVKELSKSFKELLDITTKISTNTTLNEKARQIMEGTPTNNLNDAKRKLNEILELQEKVKLQNASIQDPNLKINIDKEIKTIAAQKSIMELRTGMGALNRDAMMFKNTMGQAFGIYAVSRLAKQIVSIRGEFEMIEKSLTVLVGSAAKARKIFNEIQDIAISSPYEIKDIATQTKQLAAYGIETDKLVEKTKMLGDIASGTGVELGRLSLAYGQIRAATVLKGTEARQLTEAGVDILSDLAKYYTEIENRAVSTAEVMTRMSKKLISFEDVDEVMSRMTSIGGKFYKMQEEQAETIKGLISNLKDRASVAFNEIGEDFQPLIKGLISLAQWLLKSSDLIEGLFASLTAYKALSIFVSLIGKAAAGLSQMAVTGTFAKSALGGLRKAIGDVKVFWDFGKAAKSAKGWLEAFGATLASIGQNAAGWLGIAAALAAGIAIAIMKLTKLGRELKKIAKETQNEIVSETSKYDSLYKKIIDVTAADEDRAKALEEMKNQYGNILPLQDIELNNLDKLRDSYEQNIIALRRYIAEQGRQKAKEKILEKFNDDINIEFATKLFTRSLNRALNVNKEGIKISNKAFAQEYQNTLDAILNGELKTYGEAYVYLLKRLGELYGIGDKLSKDDKYISIIRSGRQSEFTEAFEAAKKLNDYNKEFSLEGSMNRDDLTNEINEFVKLYQNWAKTHPKAIFADFWKNTGLYPDDETARELENRFNLLLEDIAKYPASQTAKDGMKKKLVGLIPHDLKYMWGNDLLFYSPVYEDNDKEISDIGVKFLDDLSAQIAGASTPDLRKAIQQLWDKINAEFQDNDNGFKLGVGETMLADTDDLDAYSKKVKSLYDKIKDYKDRFDALDGDLETLKSQPLFMSLLNAIGAQGYWQEHQDDINAFSQISDIVDNQLKQLKELLDAMGYIDKNKEKSTLSDYKKSLAEFINSLLSTAKEWNTLDAEGQRLKNEIVRLAGKKLNIQVPDFTSVESINDFAQKLLDTKKISLKDKLDIELAINKDELKEKIDDIQVEIAYLWDEYDFANLLKEIEISIDGVDAENTLKELMAKADELRALSLSESEKAAKAETEEQKRQNDERSRDALKKAEEVDRKIKQMRQKSREEVFKLMAKAGEQASEKSIQLAIDASKDISKIINDANLGVERDDKGNVKEGQYAVSGAVVKQAVIDRQAKAFKDIADAQWEAYKGTEMYVAAFGDLDNLGADALVAIRTELEKFRDSNILNPTELKQVQNAITKMNDELAQKSGKKWFTAEFFTQLKTLADEVKLFKGSIGGLQEKMNAAFADRDTAKEDYETAKQWLETEQQRLAIAKQAYDIEMAKPEGARDANVIIEYTDAVKDEAAAQALFKSATERVSKTTEKADEATRNYTDAQKRLKQALNNANKSISKVKTDYEKLAAPITQSISLVKDFAGAFGLSFGDDTESEIDAFVSGFGLITGILGFAETAMTAYSVACDLAAAAEISVQAAMWPLLAISVVLGGLAALFKSFDNKKKKQVEAHKDAVEKLSKAYDRLKASMESALSLNEIGNTYEEQLLNLERQRQELEEAIAAEESRGNKKDDDNIKSMNEDLEELSDKAIEARKKLDEVLGAPTDYQSEAKSWASDWLSAFKDTGNGLDALSEDFDKLYDDIIAGQIQAMIMGPAIARLKDLVTDIMEDMVITPEEKNALDTFRGEVLDKVNEQGKAYLESLGIGSNISLERDTIQKGVQSLTEDTGVALESLMNSMRAHLASIDAAFASFNKGDMENPFLIQLRSQTELTRDIKTMLSSVIKQGAHRAGGSGGIRVFTD